jgi:hypothetical protein
MTPISSASPAIGTPRVACAEIVELREIAKSAMRNGEVLPVNPNATRLFFAPTGRMLARGEGYFNDSYLFLMSVQGGLSSHFNLGGGLSVLPLDNFADNAPFITPTIGVFASPKFNLAVGALRDSSAVDGRGKTRAGTCMPSEPRAHRMPASPSGQGSRTPPASSPIDPSQCSAPRRDSAVACRS